MDVETRLELIKRVGEEIITEDELRELLETKAHPIAYDGFEPSGLAPVHFGVYRAINLEDMIAAGVHFKLWIADSFAWINNKMEGDLEKIRRVGEYFIEVWRASGVNMNKVDVLWATDAFEDKEYWKKVILIAKNTSLQRATRCLTIMGRREGEMMETAQYFYPMMQAADIFHLEADICQLGMDQRRANILAREVGPKLGWWKPVVVSHHILVGLKGVQRPGGYDENRAIDIQISSKMSKSQPETCLYVHDSEAVINKKLQGAFCPQKVVEGNPVMEYAKYIIFRKFKTLRIERPRRYGGDLEVGGFRDLETMFRGGQIHPLDLKKAVAQALNEVIKPVREHFEKNTRAAELYDFVKQIKVTR
jgi:tyrosyl-tRNA synthetase